MFRRISVNYPWPADAANRMLNLWLGDSLLGLDCQNNMQSPRIVIGEFEAFGMDYRSMNPLMASPANWHQIVGCAFRDGVAIKDVMRLNPLGSAAGHADPPALGIKVALQTLPMRRL